MVVSQYASNDMLLNLDTESLGGDRVNPRAAEASIAAFALNNGVDQWHGGAFRSRLRFFSSERTACDTYVAPGIGENSIRVDGRMLTATSAIRPGRRNSDHKPMRNRSAFEISDARRRVRVTTISRRFSTKK